VIAFEVIDIGSPSIFDITNTIKTVHKGETKTVELTSHTAKVSADKITKPYEEAPVLATTTQPVETTPALGQQPSPEPVNLGATGDITKTGITLKKWSVSSEFVGIFA
jgi:hypothetical protein